MKNYLDMIPAYFCFSTDSAITLAIQYEQMLEDGNLIFSLETPHRHLLTVKEILDEISRMKCLGVISKEFAPNEIGVTGFILSESGDQQFTIQNIVTQELDMDLYELVLADNEHKENWLEIINLKSKGDDEMAKSKAMKDLKEMVQDVKDAKETLVNETGVEPTHEEIVEELIKVEEDPTILIDLPSDMSIEATPIPAPEKPAENVWDEIEKEEQAKEPIPIPEPTLASEDPSIKKPTSQDSLYRSTVKEYKKSNKRKLIIAGTALVATLIATSIFLFKKEKEEDVSEEE